MGPMNRLALSVLACALLSAAVPACADDVDPLDGVSQGAMSASASASGGSSASASGGSASASGGSTGDASGGGTDSGSSGGGAAPSHAVDMQPIWDANCVSACHEPNGSAAMTMLLTPDVSYDSLVNAPASISGLTLVVPGSREDSYLWHKLNNTQADVGGGGLKMPLGGALDAAVLESIGQWIDQGAQP